MLKKSNYLALFAIISLFCLIDGCSRSKTDKAALKNSNQGDILRVQVVPIKEIPFGTEEATESFLYAGKDAFITAKISGIIEQMYVDLGDVVRGGDTLARIEDQLLSLEAKSAQNRCDQAKQDFERGQILFDKKLISDSDYEQTKLRFQQSDIEQQLALEKLRQSRLITPFSGVVVSNWARVGQVVNAGDSLFHITEMLPIYTRVFLTEEELTRIRTEDKVRIVPKYGVGNSAWGSIIKKSPTIDPASGTVELVIRVDSQYSFLKPGMSVNVFLKTNFSSAILAVPREIFQNPESLSSGDTTWIYLYKDGKALKKAVRLGENLDSLKEIKGEFKPGDLVILKSPPGLMDGLEVKLEPQPSIR